MTTLSSYHCDVCGYDVPGFLWPVTEAPGTAGGHFVLVEGPIKVEHDQTRDYFERNIVRVRVSMDVQPMRCRDVLRQSTLSPHDAQR